MLKIQVSALGNDSCIGSTRPSLTVLCADGVIVSGEGTKATELQCPASSFLDFDILKQLHRQLDQEVIDNEFHQKVSMATITAKCYFIFQILKFEYPVAKCEM